MRVLLLLPEARASTELFRVLSESALLEPVMGCSFSAGDLQQARPRIIVCNAALRTGSLARTLARLEADAAAGVLYVGTPAALETCANGAATCDMDFALFPLLPAAVYLRLEAMARRLIAAKDTPHSPSHSAAERLEVRRGRCLLEFAKREIMRAHPIGEQGAHRLLQRLANQRREQLASLCERILSLRSCAPKLLPSIIPSWGSSQDGACS